MAAQDHSTGHDKKYTHKRAYSSNQGNGGQKRFKPNQSQRGDRNQGASLVLTLVRQNQLPMHHGLSPGIIQIISSYREICPRLSETLNRKSR